MRLSTPAPASATLPPRVRPTVRRRHGLWGYRLLQLEQKLSGGYEADLKRAALAHQRGVAVYWSRASA